MFAGHNTTSITLPPARMGEVLSISAPYAPVIVIGATKEFSIPAQGIQRYASNGAEWFEV